MTAPNTWEAFRTFPDLGPAEALRAQLEFEGVPAKIDARRLEICLETAYCVSVSSALAHRARWIVAQLPPTDEELTFLATGELSGHE